MKQHRLAIVLLSALWACLLLHRPLLAQVSAAYPRPMYVIYDHAPVYDSADHMSAIVGELRFGDSIRVLASTGRYYRIVFGEKEGYILWSNVQPDIPKRREQSVKKTRSKRSEGARQKGTASALQRSSLSGDGERPLNDSLAPVSSRETKERAGKSTGAQCQALTRNGRQCSRAAADTSGYCWQHKR